MEFSNQYKVYGIYILYIHSLYSDSGDFPQRFFYSNLGMKHKLRRRFGFSNGVDRNFSMEPTILLALKAWLAPNPQEIHITQRHNRVD